MANNQKPEKKKVNAVGILLAVMFIFIGLADEIAGDTAAAVIGLIVMIFPIVLVITLIVRIGKKRKTAVHTHDRIDHRSDLTINPATGKAAYTPVRHAAHSPQEHWKQQLDGLLANGTIDRAEYRALLNHKF